MDAPPDILREKKSREKERQRSLRKRCKKIRQRLSARYSKYFNEFAESRLETYLAINVINLCFFCGRSENYLRENRNERTTSVKKADSSNQKRMLKSIKEIEKLINSQGSAMWPNNTVTTLERNLFEVIRVLEKGVCITFPLFAQFLKNRHLILSACVIQDKNDQRAFAEYDGFTVLTKIYNFALDLPKNMSPFLPLK